MKPGTPLELRKGKSVLNDDRFFQRPHNNEGTQCV